MWKSRKQHPYMKFEGSVLWRSVEKGIVNLVKNGDLKELTSREYIVGLICQAIAGGKRSN
jgi:hypothetical protein